MKNCFLMIALSISLHGFSEMTWVNYLGNQSSTFICYSEPHTLEELCQSIKQAAAKGQTLRAIGNGFSLSDIGCTNGFLVNLRQLNQVLSIDSEKKLVRVEAGITMQALNEYLASHDLALSNQAAIAQITLGGALSTAVHGTGHSGSLSSFITEIELLTADGTVHKLSKTSHPDAFAAATVSLGSLGVIYAATLQCESLFYLHSNVEITDIETVVKNYKELNQSNDFFQFSWNVATGQVVLSRWNRCGPPKPQNSSDDCVTGYKALTWHVIDDDDRDLFSEVAVPINFLPKVLIAIKGLVKKFEAAGAKIADINIRFVEQDQDTLLSPAFDGPVAYIAFCILEQDKYLAFYKEFEDVMQQYQGRPHWGKINFLDHEKVVNLYGRNLQKFIAVKQRLDPQGLFSNAFTKRIFALSQGVLLQPARPILGQAF